MSETENPAETLRRAAALMREGSERVCRPYGRDEHFKTAVADWLDESADHLEDHSALPAEHVCPTAREGLECSVLGQAITVARAYLNEQP